VVFERIDNWQNCFVGKIAPKKKKVADASPMAHSYHRPLQETDAVAAARQ